MRCMVRQTASAALDGAEIVRGDLLEPATLDKALAGICPSGKVEQSGQYGINTNLTEANYGKFTRMRQRYDAD